MALSEKVGGVKTPIKDSCSVAIGQVALIGFPIIAIRNCLRAPCYIPLRPPRSPFLFHPKPPLFSTESVKRKTSKYHNLSQCPTRSPASSRLPSTSPRTVSSLPNVARSVRTRQLSLQHDATESLTFFFFALADSNELIKMITAVGIGFAVMGATGYIVKLSTDLLLFYRSDLQ